MVLLIGNDFPLLVTRAVALESEIAPVTCCDTSGFAAIVDHAFALVVLCETLSAIDRSFILANIRLKWPLARVIQLFAHGTPGFEPEVDAWVSTRDPERLVQRARELLCELRDDDGVPRWLQPAHVSEAPRITCECSPATLNQR